MNKDFKQAEILGGIFSANAQKSIPETLKEMPNEKLIQSFFAMKKNPEEMQNAVLQDILKHAQKSEFGQKMGFSEIKSVDDFKKKVPISSFDDYQSYIEKLKTGESDILFNGEMASFIATSGSSGVPKLIPESKNGELVKGLVSQIRAILLLMMAPEVMAPGKKVLAIANPSEYAKTEGGIGIGSASGQAAKDLPLELQKKMVLPVELIMAKDLSNEATDYLTIRYALEEKNLAGVVCSNIAHFNILLKKMNQWTDDLLEDIKTGQINSKISINEGLRNSLVAKLQPNPERAEELKEIFKKNKCLDVSYIWPDFSVVSCWMSSTAQRIVNDVKKRLSKNVKFLEWGYGASEGKFNIPDKAQDPAGLCALFGYFYEFLPIGGGQTLQAHELKQGEYYELIITSYSGLYRYNMKDIVYVEELDNQSPRIVFVCKSSEKLKLDDLELMVYEIEETIKKASEQQNEEVRFYQVLVDVINSKLVFIVEPFSDRIQRESFELTLENILMSQNSVYEIKRRSKEFAPLEIMIMKDGYRDSLFTRTVLPGKNVNQTKLKTIVNELPENDQILNWAGGKG
ncbi:GH3 auxin-responsive promoter family protein [Acetobacterium paludosum]|nr:GH3 auxin-responsive promoter family protein [Acetobacterium paludosum]